MNRHVLILNGPNLNLLGRREPEIYGSTTLAQIEEMCRKEAAAHDLEISFHQSNGEGELVDLIQSALDGAAGVVINAAGFTHTSVAILDALKAIDRPVIELHLSNPYARESFRRRSFVSPVAAGLICGLGANGYVLAVRAMAGLLDESA